MNERDRVWSFYARALPIGFLLMLAVMGAAALVGWWT